jgi:hypothetical protein
MRNRDGRQEGHFIDSGMVTAKEGYVSLIKMPALRLLYRHSELCPEPDLKIF